MKELAGIQNFNADKDITPFSKAAVPTSPANRTNAAARPIFGREDSEKMKTAAIFSGVGAIITAFIFLAVVASKPDSVGLGALIGVSSAVGGAAVFSAVTAGSVAKWGTEENLSQNNSH